MYKNYLWNVTAFVKLRKYVIKGKQQPMSAFQYHDEVIRQRAGIPE